jgi:K+ transporter
LTKFCLDCDDSDSDSDDIIDDYPSMSSIRNRFNVLTNVPLSSISNKIELNNNENEFPISVTPGVGCFLTHSCRQSPHVFESYVRLVRSVPQMIIFVRIQYARVPFIDREKRLLIKLYGDIYHISATFGYAETKKKSVYEDILLLGKELYQLPIPSTENKITFFIPNQIIVISKKGWKSWISRWPLYLYSIQKSLVPRQSINIRMSTKNTIQIGIIAEL